MMNKKTDITLDYYNTEAAQFTERTQHSDFSELRNVFYSYIKPHGHILDLGCGCGRDSKVFLDAGYTVTAVDGSEALCKMASEFIGQDVICSTFQDYKPTEKFDGIWACAALLHLSEDDIISVMKKLAKNLRSGGCFFASFKYGDFEGIRKERFFYDMTEKKFQKLLKKLPEYKIITAKIGQDVRPGREDEMWLYTFLKRI